MKMCRIISVNFILVVGLLGQTVRAQGVLDLTETYSEMGLTFNYPTEWNVKVDEDGVVLLQNKPNIDYDDLKPGEVFIGFLLPSNTLFPSAEDLDTAFEILQYSLKTEQLSEPEPVTIGGMEGFQVEFITADSDNQLAITLVDTQMFVILLQTPKGELVNYLDQFMAILETVTYEPETYEPNALPELTETYSEEGLTFQYPAGWVIDKSERGFLILKNSPTVDIEEFHLEEGEMVISIVTPVDFAELGMFNLSMDEAIQIIMNGEDETFSTTLTINNRKAPFAGFGDSSKDVASLAIPFEDGILVMGYQTNSGESVNYQALFLDIAKTVDYQAPPDALP